MTSEQPSPPTHAVQDGGRILRFSGERIAEVSSERASSPRWTVLTVYRTARGMYVLARVGRSRVYHTADCSMAVTHRLPYGHERRPADVQPFETLSPCVLCSPSPELEEAVLRFEVDRSWAGVADDAEALVEMLHRTENGTRSLPWLASHLLSDAATKDPAVASAFAFEIL